MSWKEFEKACNEIANKLDKPIDCVYGLPSGGLVPALTVADILNIPSVTLNVDDLTDHTLVISDRIDTGERLEKLTLACKKKIATVATIAYNKESMTTPDIWVMECKGNEIVFPWEME